MSLSGYNLVPLIIGLLLSGLIISVAFSSQTLSYIIIGIFSILLSLVFLIRIISSKMTQSTSGEITCSLFLKARSESWSCIRSLLKERMRSPPIQMMYLMYSSPDKTPQSVLLMRGDVQKTMIEKEVIKTSLLATCKDVRIEDVCINELDDVFRTISYLFPRKIFSWGKLQLFDSDIIDSANYYYPIIEESDSIVSSLENTGVYVGTVLNTRTPMSFYLRPELVYGRIGIFGSTGSGKSTTAALISARLSKTKWFTSKSRKPKIIVFDWHGEFDKLFKNMDVSYYVVNPLSSGLKLGMFCYEKLGLEEVIEMLGEAFSLSNPQINLIAKILEEKKPVNLYSLSRILESGDEYGYWTRELKQAILRKLYLITKSKYTSIFSSKCSNLEDVIINKREPIIIIDLFSVHNVMIRRIIAFSLLAELYKTSQNKHYNIILLIDEAQNLIRDESSLITNIIVEGRKFGIGIIIVTQNPSVLPKEIMANLNTKIVHTIKSGEDKRVIGEAMSLDSSTINLLDKLDVGEAIIQSPEIGEPVLVKIVT